LFEHRESAVSSVPIIYTPSVQPQKLTASGRVAALVVALSALAIVVVEVMLPPSPTGEGTHRQMGLQQCQFLATTGIPCPTCGMTTSFSWFVRGNWLASFYIQPMGFVLALLTGALFWATLYMAITGSPLQRLLRQLPAHYLVVAMIGFAIAAWGWKIFIYLHGIDGWH
jgi:hypothetical protein